jgi:hypothetical protein
MTERTQLLEALVVIRDLLAVLDNTVNMLEEVAPGLKEVGRLYWTSREKAVYRHAQALASVAPGGPSPEPLPEATPEQCITQLGELSGHFRQLAAEFDAKAKQCDEGWAALGKIRYAHRPDHAAAMAKRLRPTLQDIFRLAKKWDAKIKAMNKNPFAEE